MSEIGRPCSICTHDSFASVNAELLAGASLRDIAGRFGVSKSALSRHARGCISELIAAASDFDESISAAGLVKELNELRRVTLEILNEARDDGESHVALSAIARLEKQAELIGRLAGELIERREVREISLLVHADWVALRERVVRALRDHPVALLAVVAELADVEGLA